SKVSSPSAIKAIGTIPQGEEKDVMRLILEELRQHSNWSEIPSGFAGAFLLAQELEETRPQFKAFISEVMPKLKPWFKSLIKEEVWFNN
ncbi:NTPase KAP, partial [Acinetobacter baumannii]|nr:NTPase KAP [Acinetobacter baumannii]